MFDVKIDVSGLKDLDKVLMKEVVKVAMENTKRAIGGLRCSVHGNHPSVSLSGDRLSVSACCQALLDQVKAKLR